MKSPFPGMDPYLEQHWRDVHHALVTYARDRLQPALPPSLRARVEERVYVESESRVGRSLHPYVRVVERKGKARAKPRVQGHLVVAEPLLVHVDDESVSEGYVEIIDVASGRRVVTVIEFLSPSNKVPGEGQDLYLRKQGEIKRSSTSLVEIDLTRQGKRILLLPSERVPPPYRTTYQVCVRRGYRHSPVEIYDVPLRERLPVIGIPLREGEDDVALDLQALVDACYLNGAYDDIEYDHDPVPPLDPGEAGWADALLRSKGLRRKKRRRR